MASTSDSPIIMPSKNFDADQKEHRQNNQAIETFGQFSAYGFVPVGTLMAFVGLEAPPGYLECDGSAISRQTYAALFETIATQFGVGDGSTTFNIPTFAQAVAFFVAGHLHGGVTAGGANTSATSTPAYGFYIIRTGVQ